MLSPVHSSAPNEAAPAARGAIAQLGRAVTRSYWQRSGNMPLAPATPNDLPASASHVIIGGGFAGLSTALRMKELDPGADIVLIEAHRVGYGASGRNGGLMSPLPAPVWLTTALHDESHARALRLLTAKVAEAARWAHKLAPEAEVATTELALEAKGRITDAGLAHISRTLKATAIAHRFPAKTQAGPRTLVLPAHTVHPYKLVRGLAAAARARGVTIIEQAPVADIADHGPAGATVSLTDGRAITAGTVVVATNAYSPALRMAAPPRAKVVYNYVLATGPLDPQLLARLEAEGKSTGHFIVELNAAYVFYRVHDGRLVFGGIEKLKQAEGGDLDVPAAIMQGLRKHLSATLDGLPLPEIVEAWGGRYHMTSTDLPVIRRPKPTSAIVYNVGYGGTGVALTLSLAPLAAAIALNRPPADDELAVIHDTMCNTRTPVVGAVRFGAGVAATYFRERWQGSR